jgi:hypothetical protein
LNFDPFFREITVTKKTTGWMGALTLTAIMMCAILIAGHERQAEGAMLNAQAGFSLMTTGGVNGDEMLIVIDKSSQKMLVYNLINANELKLIAGYNLGAK